MDIRKKPPLKLIQSGVPGLDELCGGGLPEYSFNLIAGRPGSGKTTLAHQIVFTNATEEHPALYFTVIGEPALKMLRYQQQMGFFDAEKVATAVRFVDLSPEIISGDLDALLATFVAQLRAVGPRYVVVDSFRSVMRSQGSTTREGEIQGFLQKLGLILASFEATTFLVGEYSEEELNESPVAAVADGIILMSQQKERNATVRKMQVIKVRGRHSLAGSHTFRIQDSGIQVFPRKGWRATTDKPPVKGGRLSTGIPKLDALIGGGIPAGDLTLIAGPSGVGKTMFCTQFLYEGAERGEKCVLAIFEEQRGDYLARAKDIGFDLQRLVDEGKLAVVDLRPFDVSADEILIEIRQEVVRMGASRLVIDSLNGLELCLAPHYRDDFRESLYRMLGGVSDGGVTVALTVEVTESSNKIPFSPHAVSFLAQNILFFRWVELSSQLARVLTVVKMRRSAHSHLFHAFNVSDSGLKIGEPLTEYEGIFAGVARRRESEWLAPGSHLSRIQVAILELLQLNGETSETELRLALGMKPEEVAAALEGLTAQQHVGRVPDKAATTYRLLVRSS